MEWAGHAARMTGTPIYDTLAAQIFTGASHRPEQTSREAVTDTPGTDGRQQAERPAADLPSS